jgi:hypothetical protein
VRKAFDPALLDALKEHNATLKGDIEALKEQLASEKAQVAEANGRADQAIAALRALADEIAKLAETRSRPWWRRLVG